MGLRPSTRPRATDWGPYHQRNMIFPSPGITGCSYLSIILVNSSLAKMENTAITDTAYTTLRLSQGNAGIILRIYETLSQELVSPGPVSAP